MNNLRFCWRSTINWLVLSVHSVYIGLLFQSVEVKRSSAIVMLRLSGRMSIIIVKLFIFVSDLGRVWPTYFVSYAFKLGCKNIWNFFMVCLSIWNAMTIYYDIFNTFFARVYQATTSRDSNFKIFPIFFFYHLQF